MRRRNFLRLVASAVMAPSIDLRPAGASVLGRGREWCGLQILPIEQHPAFEAMAKRYGWNASPGAFPRFLPWSDEPSPMFGVTEFLALQKGAIR